MQKVGAILTFLMVACLTLFGQSIIRISGLVRNANGENLANATISFVSSLDSLNSISASDGHFAFTVNKISSFELIITMQDYKTFRKSFLNDPAKNSIVLSPIILTPKYEELVPVMVTATKPLTIMEDTVEYNASSYKLRPGAELERLMKRLPGIYWDTGGNVIMNGKQIKRVLLNGQLFIAGDIKNALQNLPADIIDKVQVIDDYGDKAKLTGVKSGESEKVLNIILKNDKRNGWIGGVELGRGDKDRYSESLFLDGFKNGRQLSLSGALTNNSPTGDDFSKIIYMGGSNKWSPKWSGGGGLGISEDNKASGSSMSQNNYLASSLLNQKQISHAVETDLSSNSSFYAIYTPDSNTKLRINESLNISQSRDSISQIFSNQVQDSGFNKLTNGNTFNNTRANSLSTNSGVYFETNNPHSGNRLSIEISHSWIESHSNEDDLNQVNILADSFNNQSLQHYIILSTSGHREIDTRVNYYRPMSKNAMFELGYSWTYSSIINKQIAEKPDSLTGTPIQIDSLSSTYLYHTVASRMHVGYLIHSNKLNLDLSIDAQHAAQYGQLADKSTPQSYHYFDFLPAAQLSYSFSIEKKLNFNYSASTTPPSLQQLQPIAIISNPQYPVIGNPSLKPTYSQSATLQYEQHSLKQTQYYGFVIGLAYSNSWNMIISNLVHPHDNSSVVQETSYLNANGFYSYGLNYRFDFPSILHKWIRISVDGNIGTINNAVMTDNVLYSIKSFGWGQGLQISLNIPNITETVLATSYAHTLTSYPPGKGIPFSSSTLNWLFNSRHELFQKWVLNYNVSQVFTTGQNNNLTANPAILNASLQRDLFPKNQARIIFAINNLLNSNTGTSQSITSTSITQNQSFLIGRFFLISIAFKLERFH